jgi:riboflavin kinase/FMN adenylyltransferase
VPTINVTPHPRKLLPPDGVYAARVASRAGEYGAMLNLGPRPTFGETARVLEAHLFEFAGDLYGQGVTVDFVARLRDVARFATPQDLRAQLERDRLEALAALSRDPGPVTL